MKLRHKTEPTNTSTLLKGKKEEERTKGAAALQLWRVSSTRVVGGSIDQQMILYTSFDEPTDPTF